MSHVDLLPCPICNATPAQPKREGGGNEYNGYCFNIAIRCKCGLVMLTESEKDNGGWCIDKGEALARAILLWNGRATKQQDVSSALIALQNLTDALRFVPLGLGPMHHIRAADDVLAAYKKAATIAKEPVSWRFWVDDPTSALKPNWGGWSSDGSYRDLMFRYAKNPNVKVKVEYAYADGKTFGVGENNDE